ncbi:MAG: hypothetical protein ACKOX2_11010, partial [Microcystaceae cyanobacterium]
ENTALGLKGKGTKQRYSTDSLGLSGKPQEKENPDFPQRRSISPKSLTYLNIPAPKDNPAKNRLHPRHPL